MTGWKTWKVGLGLGFLSFEFQQNFMKRPFPKILSLKNRAVFMLKKLCFVVMQEFEQIFFLNHLSAKTFFRSTNFNSL